MVFLPQIIGQKPTESITKTGTKTRVVAKNKFFGAKAESKPPRKQRYGLTIDDDAYCEEWHTSPIIL